MRVQVRSLRAGAALAVGAWLVAAVAVVVLVVAGAVAGRAGLHAHRGPVVLAAGTGDIHIGSGG